MTELDNYVEFVDTLTSNPSKDKAAFFAAVEHLYDQGCAVDRLLTAAVGISAEGGEFMEIVKKCIFQGKPYNEDIRFHLKRELGDIAFYFANACLAIGETPISVLEENVNKLEARYPGGKFAIHNSENRKEGDI
jgi:NTP pyrophosphatase (non-canonical NTP hydrolase)